MDVKKFRLRIRFVVAIVLVIAVIGLLCLHLFQSNSTAAVFVLYQEEVNVGDGESFDSSHDLYSRKPVWRPCHDGLCTDVLWPGERELFKACINDTQHPKLNKLSEGPLVEMSPSPCRFVRSSEKARNETVLLVSFSGSGNTWTRGLLQQATGFCTGSHVCDIDLRRHGFPGEGVMGKENVLTTTMLRNTYWKDIVH